MARIADLSPAPPEAVADASLALAATRPPPAGSAMARPPAGLAAKAHAPLGEVVLLGALTALGSVAMDMYLPALPHIASALHARPGQAQATVTVFLFGFAISQLIYGPLSDRVGRRGPILVGVAVYLAASAACAWAPSIEAMTGARMLQAMGACGGGVLARAVVRDRYEDHEVLHVFSMLSLVFGVSPVLAPLIGSWVLGAGGWRWIFGVQALVGLVVGAGVWMGLPETRSAATALRARSERPVSAYLALLADRRLLGYLVVGGLSGAVLFSYLTAGPDVLISLHHLTPLQFGWVFAINSVALIGAGQINARLARRVQADRIVRVALWVSLGAGLTLLFCAATGALGVGGVAAPLFVLLACFGFIQPNISAAAMAVDRLRAGTTAALLGGFSFGLGGLAGSVTGWLHDGTGRPLGAVIVSLCVAALVAHHLLVAAPRRRLSAQSAGV